MVLLPGKSRGQRSLAGYSPWVHKELDATAHICTNYWKIEFSNGTSVNTRLTVPKEQKSWEGGGNRAGVESIS